MEAARFRCDPDLAARLVTIDDEFAAGAAVDGEDAVVQCPVDVGVALVECRGDRTEHAVGQCDEVALGAHRMATAC